MQNDQKIEEGMASFMMPVNALEVAGFVDGEMLKISAKKGKIVIKRAQQKRRKCSFCEEGCPFFED